MVGQQLLCCEHHLAAQPGQAGLVPFLQDLQALNTDLMDVCDALHELSHTSAWDLWGKLRQYARLVPDPLRRVRAHMRLIRQRYGELPAGPASPSAGPAPAAGASGV
jgi:hypothetical protein